MTQEVLKLALDWAEAHGEIVFAGGGMSAVNKMNSWVAAIKEALAQPEQEPVTWGVDWGRAGDIPCVSIIKRLPNGGIEVVAVEYVPYTFKEKNT